LTAGTDGVLDATGAGDAGAFTETGLATALVDRFATGLTDARTAGFGAGMRAATGFAADVEVRLERVAGVLFALPLAAVLEALFVALLTVRFAAGFAAALAEVRVALFTLVLLATVLLTAVFLAAVLLAAVLFEAALAGVAATVFAVAARRVPAMDAVRVVVRFAEGFGEVFEVLAAALVVRLAAGFAAALLTVRLAAGFAAAFRSTVVSSMCAPTALRATDLTPFIAAAFEPYGCDVATTDPLGACRVNRNLPALSLLMVNFAGTNASRCGAVRPAAAGGLRSSTGVLVGITLRRYFRKP
jgi:hypothetical protein